MDFTNATITANVIFDEADLRGAKFNLATFDTVSFQNAEVSESFVEELKSWKIKGDKVFNNYIFIQKPIQGKAGRFRYFLVKKTMMPEYLITEHVKLEEINY